MCSKRLLRCAFQNLQFKLHCITNALFCSWGIPLASSKKIILSLHVFIPFEPRQHTRLHVSLAKTHTSLRLCEFGSESSKDSVGSQGSTLS